MRLIQLIAAICRLRLARHCIRASMRLAMIGKRLYGI